MRQTSIVAIPVLTLLAACGTTTGTYQGYAIDDFFPLDGERTWEYSQLQEDIVWKLRVEKVSQTLRKGSTEVVTLEYYNDETGDLLYTIDWSSDSSDGVQVWGYSDEATGDSVSYDPPVGISNRYMNTGEFAETTTDGRTFTSTFEGVESCPNDWRTDWECVHMSVDDGDDDDTTGPPFAGDWWLATSYGASRFVTTGYTDAWVLYTATFESGD